LVEQQLGEIGVNIEIEQTSYDRYLSEIWMKAPLYVGYYGMRFTEDGILYLLLHSEGSWNEAHWSDDEYDQVIEDARQTTDNDERAELYARAQQILYERGPYLISFFQNEIGAQRNYVEGYELDPTGFFVPTQDVTLSEDAPTR
jgi:peptide/nickel transport system substrate-binding protein